MLSVDDSPTIYKTQLNSNVINISITNHQTLFNLQQHDLKDSTLYYLSRLNHKLQFDDIQWNEDETSHRLLPLIFSSFKYNKHSFYSTIVAQDADSITLYMIHNSFAYNLIFISIHIAKDQVQHITNLTTQLRTVLNQNDTNHISVYSIHDLNGYCHLFVNTMNNKSFQVVHSPKLNQFFVSNYDHDEDCRLFGNGRMLYKTKYNKFNIVESIRSPLPIDYIAGDNLVENAYILKNKDGEWMQSPRKFIIPSQCKFDHIFLTKGNRWCIILNTTNFTMHVIDANTGNCTECDLDSFISPHLQGYKSCIAIITNNDSNMEQILTDGFIRRNSTTIIIPKYLRQLACKFLSNEILYFFHSYYNHNIVFYFTLDSLFDYVGSI